MAKYQLRLKARNLRAKGTSVKDIAKQLGVAKSTASVWVRDIILTVEQLEKLRLRVLVGGELGRTKGAFMQKQRRAQQMLEFERLGVKQIGKLTERELLLVGLALYWGEGYKKGRRLQFCNSDPSMMQFMLSWLKRCFSIKSNEITCRVGINAIHQNRDLIVKQYWSDVMSIPLEQFTKTSFKKVQSKKIYENLNNHFGTLSIEVKQPSRFYGKIIGLIEGLANSAG